jgi:serine/threonine protein kinase
MDVNFSSSAFSSFISATPSLMLCSSSGAQPEPLAHRDLKTANILIDENWNPVLMDLGRCKK